MAAISDKQAQRIRKLISEANMALAAVEELLLNVVDEGAIKSQIKEEKSSQVSRVIEGIFNGQNMTGDDGKIYPIPANYASKSQLVEGDRMKLTIEEDGSFLFKQIGPIERQQVVGQLQQQDGSYFLNVDNRLYQVLLASVTHHKIKPGDQVSADIPLENPDTSWAAIKSPL